VCSLLLVSAWVALTGTGCYQLRPSNGTGQETFTPPRKALAADVALPTGFRIEPIATGLTFPTGVTFDSDGRVYVIEAGYSYGEVWTKPRLLKVEANGGLTQIVVGKDNGPWTGVTFYQGAFYVAEGGELEGGRILRITPDGNISLVVSNLPSMGDHHSNGPVIGPDGWLYFGQGTVSNSGVVGEDNANFGWLERRREIHDIPGEDITLTGQNFKTRNVIDGKGKIVTGAFSPFGTPSVKNQVIKGGLPCSGSVMRVKADGSHLELVAWGFRNPFGLAFSPDGKLFVTDNGYDDRGSRPVWGAADVLWRVENGMWYGWPDYSAGMRLDQEHFKPPGKKQPRFLLVTHPNRPPDPAAIFAVHSSADGFDFSRSPKFGHEGQAFVALFGDEAPTTGKVLYPVGAQVVRVNVRNGLIEQFAVNKGHKNGPASKIGSYGLERPIAARFNPAGDALYVVDFGVMMQTKTKAHPVEGTGVLWRISRGLP